MKPKLLQNLIDSAAQIYPGKEIMQQVVVTQAIHESGFLSKSGGSQLALRYNNLFGIKAKKGYRKTPPLTTWEYINGRNIQVKVPFAAFDDYAQSFECHKKIMELSRYKGVVTATTVPVAFKALVTGGWATDPRYAKKLEEIWSKYVKPEFIKS